MRWSFLNSDFKPAEKHMPWPAVLAAGIAATGSLTNNMASASFSDHAAKENRKWQEAMYNKYYSPEAMMQQYRKAGVNPLLESSGTGLQASSFSPQGQQAITPNFENVGQAGVQGYNLGTQYELNAGAAANQRSQYVLNSIRAINEAFIQGGYQSGMNMINQLMPQFKAFGFDSHQVMLMTADIRLTTASKATIDLINAQWARDFGYEKNSTELMKLNQEISNLVGQTNVLESQSELNRASAAELGSRIARNYAEAFKLKKEGDYYVVNADTARKMQTHLIANMILQNGNLATEFERLDVALGNERAAAEMKRAISSNPYLQYIQWGCESLGNIIHIGLNGSYRFGTAKSLVESYSDIKSDANVNSRSYVNSTSNVTGNNMNMNYNYNMTPK